MWDPSAYLHFTDYRERPFSDLLARVGAQSPRRVVDVGCGPGTLTPVLAQRWPDAAVEAFDSSQEMVAAAREHGVDATVGDVHTWTPGADVDVVVCNAVLQWVPEHLDVLTRWAQSLGSGAWLAVQVPGNFREPSHALTRELAGQPQWRNQLDGVLRGSDAVHEPQQYVERLVEFGCTVDAWESTYLQRLPGTDPVLRWITGTALRPVRTVLGDADWALFTEQLAPMLREAYPESALAGESGGGAWMPFRRLFVVAQIGAH